MQEKQPLSEQCIIEYLKLYYHIEVHTLTFIPLGADSDALLYKADTPDHSYFIKFRYGLHEDINITIMKLLHNAGLKHIILPTLTTQGQSIQPIGDNLTLLVYPFIAGENAFSHCLTDTQWRIVGKALRQLHEIQVPPAIQQRLRQEAYSPKWRDSVRLLYNYIETGPTGDSIALELKAFMKENEKAIRRLVHRAEQLAQTLQNECFQFVLCHSDIHAGNVLIDRDNAIYIVDWDNPMMAPKERDLMFIGGGVGNVWNNPREEALFYEGYGKTNINKTMLAYYRHERIVEDIALFGKSLLCSTSGGETRAESYKHFKAMFAPNGVVDIAFRTDES